MTMHKILTGGLPTTLSKAIAGLTLLAIPAAYNFPSLFPPTWLPNQLEQLFLIRLLLSLLLLSLGSLITLFLVVQAYNNLASRHAFEIETIGKAKPHMRISQAAIDAASEPYRR